MCNYNNINGPGHGKTLKLTKRKRKQEDLKEEDRMNFKKITGLLLAGAMVTTAIPAYAEGSDVTLSVSIWGSEQEQGIKEILADFTEQTGIKTEISVVKWDEYWTMLEAGAQGGSLPDVFWIHVQ